MRSLIILLFWGCTGFSQAEPDLIIHFEKEVCYAAKTDKNGEIELMHREWYCAYCNDTHILRLLQ
jgi:hypothetical protein